MKKMNFFKVLFISLGCCCVIAAAALGVHNLQTSTRASVQAQWLAESLRNQTNAQAGENSELASGLEQRGKESADDALEVLNIQGYDICGSINIPAIDVELAVISDWSYDALELTACRYSGSYENQLIVMAHNYAKHFGHLDRLSLGDEVLFTSISGEEYAYQVDATETWATEELTEIVSGDDWDLTLFTCTYSGTGRTVIRCVLVET